MKALVVLSALLVLSVAQIQPGQWYDSSSSSSDEDYRRPNDDRRCPSSSIGACPRSRSHMVGRESTVMSSCLYMWSIRSSGPWDRMGYGSGSYASFSDECDYISSSRSLSSCARIRQWWSEACGEVAITEGEVIMSADSNASNQNASSKVLTNVRGKQVAVKGVAGSTFIEDINCLACRNCYHNDSSFSSEGDNWYNSNRGPRSRWDDRNRYDHGKRYDNWDRDDRRDNWNRDNRFNNWPRGGDLYGSSGQYGYDVRGRYRRCESWTLVGVEQDCADYVDLAFAFQDAENCVARYYFRPDERIYVIDDTYRERYQSLPYILAPIALDTRKEYFVFSTCYDDRSYNYIFAASGRPDDEYTSCERGDSNYDEICDVVYSCYGGDPRDIYGPELPQGSCCNY